MPGGQRTADEQMSSRTLEPRNPAAGSTSCTKTGVSITAIVMIILLTAFAFRVAYAVSIGPGVDEYITVLAVQQVHQTGIPRLPSGFLYDHGVLFVYLDAAATALFGTSWLGFRFLSVICSVILIAVIFRMGKEGFSSQAGIIAAWIVALIPGMVAPGAHIRMHALLQLLLLISAFALFEGVARRDNRKWRLVGVIALSAATFAHLLAIPFIAVLLIGIAASRIWFRQCNGRKISLRQFPGIEILIFVAAGTLRWWLRVRSGPWGVGGRVVTDPQTLWDIERGLIRILGWSHQFVIWPYLILSMMIATGGLGMIIRIRRDSCRPDDIPRAFLGFVWLGTLVGLALSVGLHSPGYVVPLIPFWALLGAAEIDLLGKAVESTTPSRPLRAAILAAVLAATTLLLIPHTIDSVNEDPFELDKALRFVRTHAHRDDLILSTTPVPVYLELGWIDYYAREQGAEAVVGPDGSRGIWLSTPVLRSAQQLERILLTDRRVWVLVDVQSWDRDLSLEYRELVLKWTHCNDEFRGMLVCVTAH
jgi:4-amino-4-deoxy-L-arabinose transferase-like glycosyltransferase